MDWLEDELKSALARKEPSADFAERVLRQAALDVAVDKGKVIPFRGTASRQWHRWAAAAAAVVMVAGAGLGYREYRGEMAKEQVMQAMKIASSKLNRIQSHVQEAGR